MKTWIWPYVKENKRLFAVVIALAFLTVFSSAALLFTSGFLISKSATRPENILLVYVPIVAVRTFGISRAAFKYVERLMGHHTVLKILANMRVRVYTSVEPQVLAAGFKRRTGDLLGVLADDIERLQDIYIKTVFPSLAAIALYLVAIAALGLYSWSFAMLMAIYAGVLVILFPLASLLVTKARVKQMKEQRHALYEQLTDAVMGLSEWQFSGRAQEFVDRYETSEQAWQQLDASQARFTRWRNTAAQVIVLGMLVSMLSWTGGEVASGALEAVFIAAFVLVLFPLTEVFLPLSDAIADVPSYQDSLDRLEGLSENDPFVGKKGPIGERENGLREDFRGKRLEAGAMAMVMVNEQKDVAIGGELVQTEAVTLQVSNVHFAHGGTKQVLAGVNMRIAPGETVALLGRSGSGKSTIASLVRGDYVPDSGTVTLNGVATSGLGDEVSSWVAVLNQQPHVFDTTVMNNIRLGRPSASDEAVYEVAKQVRLHDYIMNLPDGYQTPLHETGMRFSGGERQRIALARILLQKTPFVILDEPTVGLDPVTESALLETIFDVFREKSVLWITHHLSFIDRSDRVLFLESGRVAMEGTHEELLATNPRYQQLYALK